MKYQYSIKVQIKNGSPYITGIYDSFDDVVRMLDSLIKKDEHYHRPFFVYNDFYHNKYTDDLAVSRYKVQFRPVGQWSTFQNLDIFCDKNVDTKFLLW